METNERILISENKEILEQIKTDLGSFRPPLKNVIEAYKSLRLGEFDSKVYGQIKAGQADTFVKKYKQALNKELDETKVFNPKLRENLLNGTDEAGIIFIQAAKDFLDFKAKPRGYRRNPDNVLTLDFISFENGDLVITDQDEEGILEYHCRYYLETDEQKKLYAIIQPLCENFKDLLEMTKKLGLDYLTNRSFNMIDLFVNDIGPDVKPDMEQIISACKYTKVKERLRM